MGTKFWGKGFLGKVLWGQNVGDKDFEITFVAQKRLEERFSSGEDWMQSKKKQPENTHIYSKFKSVSC